MSRVAGPAALALVASVLLGACSSPSAYCQKVETDQKALDSFGKERTTKAFAADAKRFRALAKLAPADVADDWTALADVTERVLAVHEKAGITLEEADDPAVLAETSSKKLDRINDAYATFNATSKQRAAVVKNVADECDIDLL
jgi:hypothetical protein